MSAIERVSLSEQVLKSIVHYVQTNGLQVGDKLLTESEFSDLFQVSRTSVREAMKALGINGAVKSIPGKGTYIREPMLNYILNDSEKLEFEARVSIHQIIEVRLAVELLAGELATERASEEDILRVEEAMQDLRKAVLSQNPWAVQGAKFHVRIAESTKNPLIIKLIESYSDTVGHYRDALVDFNTPQEMKNHIQEHEDILNALRNRDKKAMEVAIRKHLMRTEENLEKLVHENAAIDYTSK
ncbi:GntR family transcriptional repressor for pyruvate dehydrogenase complex [Peptoniphilus ivorii]|uniref:FadR/GntR family transcriptional regulator n=1 Tax=Aedoeadaptatus ivorii TaxID=54006 RepID=UPI002780FDA0|nr:FadR/GntR family transcriptional regulator [Peptoniphilus ivorii]MDQ0508381.1 GntR family transcriptional repressor for pyruvate dehydrogenase complex [Peptoniphilus ivorii]